MLRRLLAATRPPAAALRRMLYSTGGSGKAESMAYRMSMLRPPSVVSKYDPNLTRNSCSLIGRLDAPVRPRNFRSNKAPVAYTFLSVGLSSSAPSSSSSGFKVTLDFKDELASVSLKHLKTNDLVYVAGFLSSYLKVSSSGERYIVYKLFVNELNYVLDPSLTYVAPRMQKENEYIDRLRLWQLFFANPYEWWDNRESKPYDKYPDFKHKDTREKIWIHPDDPPWVRKQLELHDLKRKKIGHPSKNHAWKAQDFDYSNDDDELQHSAEA